MTAAARSRRGKHAAEHGHMVSRLLAIFAAAPSAALEDGGLWYPRAEETVAALAHRFGLGVPATAGIVAVLSPRQRWRKNVESAAAVLAGEPWRVAAYDANKAKAARLAAGAHPLDVVSGDKVSRFWANLIGSRECVTVDVWAAQAALGRPLKDAPKRAAYDRIERAYIAAARRVGCPPREFQAIIWLATRPAAEHAKDVAHVGAICS